LAVAFLTVAFFTAFFAVFFAAFFVAIDISPREFGCHSDSVLE
jgi:hypothetical protein